MLAPLFKLFQVERWYPMFPLLPNLVLLLRLIPTLGPIGGDDEFPLWFTLLLLFLFLYFMTFKAVLFAVIAAAQFCQWAGIGISLASAAAWGMGHLTPRPQIRQRARVINLGMKLLLGWFLSLMTLLLVSFLIEELWTLSMSMMAGNGRYGYYPGLLLLGIGLFGRSPAAEPPVRRRYFLWIVSGITLTIAGWLFLSKMSLLDDMLGLGLRNQW
jgi:hypothetical protein